METPTKTKKPKLVEGFNTAKLDLELSNKKLEDSTRNLSERLESLESYRGILESKLEKQGKKLKFLSKQSPSNSFSKTQPIPNSILNSVARDDFEERVVLFEQTMNDLCDLLPSSQNRSAKETLRILMSQLRALRQQAETKSAGNSQRLQIENGNLQEELTMLKIEHQRLKERFRLYVGVTPEQILTSNQHSKKVLPKQDMTDWMAKVCSHFEEKVRYLHGEGHRPDEIELTLTAQQRDILDSSVHQIARIVDRNNKRARSVSPVARLVRSGRTPENLSVKNLLTQITKLKTQIETAQNESAVTMESELTQLKLDLANQRRALNSFRTQNSELIEIKKVLESNVETLQQDHDELITKMIVIEEEKIQLQNQLSEMQKKEHIESRQFVNTIDHLQEELINAKRKLGDLYKKSSDK